MITRHYTRYVNKTAGACQSCNKGPYLNIFLFLNTFCVYEWTPFSITLLITLPTDRKDEGLKTMSKSLALCAKKSWTLHVYILHCIRNNTANVTWLNVYYINDSRHWGEGESHIYFWRKMRSVEVFLWLQSSRVNTKLKTGIHQGVCKTITHQPFLLSVLSHNCYWKSFSQRPSKDNTCIVMTMKESIV